MPTGDLGACARCGGRLTATHMLLRTWPLDARGHWLRRLDHFSEDILIACAACGHPPAGSVQRCGNRYRFVPGYVTDGAGTAP